MDPGTREELSESRDQRGSKVDPGTREELSGCRDQRGS